MPYYFGDWLKEQRKIFGISQEGLANMTENQLTQSTISNWEKKINVNPSIESIHAVASSLGYLLCEVPLDYMKFTKLKDESGGREMKEKFSMYDLPSASSLKTFEGKVYELKGAVGVEQKTGEVRHITDLYYRTRSVVSDSRLLAKRKCEDDELLKVKGIKKIK